MSSKSISKQETGPPKVLSQKEYLKKYLSNDSSSKKKKKKKIAPSSIQRSKIVNDDLDLKSMQLLGENELDLFQVDEDAPQIAGIIDERPPELQTLETYRNSKRWKVISESDELTVSDKYAEAEEKKKLNSINNKEVARRFISHSITIEKPSGTRNSDMKSISEPGRSEALSKSQSSRKDSKFDSSKEFRKSKRKADSDESRPRSNRKRNSGNDSDLSPARPPRERHKGSDSDPSPPRLSKTIKAHESRSKSDRSPYGSSKRYQTGNDSDLSPPRPSKRHKSNSDSDPSPIRASRKNKRGSDSDLSPPRPSRKYKAGDSDSDLSPPRPSRKFNGGNDSDLSPPRPSRRYKSGNDSDLSPPRPSRRDRSGNNSDLSPPRSSKKYNLSNKIDASPRRPFGKHKSGYDADLSPQRSKRRRSTSDSDLSPPRPSRKFEKDHGLSREKKQYSHNTKPSASFSSTKRNFDNYRSTDFRNSREDNQDRKSRFKDRSPENSRNSSQNKMKETLSGKKAGLQDAAALKEENVKFKEKEDRVFKEMSASVSGEGATAVVRDRRTGRRRDPQKEEEYKKKKNAANEAMLEKYAVWNKGVAQVKESRQLLEEHLHEMAKPFARHADDKDLDEFLKSQEREGDPMLEYLREKKVKSGASVNETPVYKGPYPPNRFNIRPGYRWDGVDRSTGFEKQWFNKQNERKAVSEEAYKWSTSDM